MIKQLLRITLLTALSTFLLSCGNSLPNRYPNTKISRTESGNTLIVTEDFSAIILTKEFLDVHSPWVPPVPPAAFWSPEVDQVLYIESNLEKYLSQHNSAFHSGHAPNKEELTKYGRQYYGILISDGYREIHAKFFCPESIKNFDWKNQVMDVKGGGDCFFGVGYNPDTRKFIGVAANASK